MTSGTGRLMCALALALLAETVSFVAPETWAWKGLGLAIAAVAVGLAGLGTYKKGWFALKNGKLNINALMTVAVTGAFLIGQWPEAAMVMALYAIAELIEARSIDRARNAIKGLLALTPDPILIDGKLFEPRLHFRAWQTDDKAHRAGKEDHRIRMLAALADLEVAA